MLRTYRAILVENRLEWKDEAPKHADAVHVHVTVLEPAPDARPSGGAAAAAALQCLADRGGLSGFGDPAEWQRDVRP